MTKNEAIHMLSVLRNPWGHGEPQLRQSRHDAANEIERMRAELAALRADASDHNRIIYLALMIATFSNHNASRTAGECRDAAIELFGQGAIDAAMAIYKEQT